jgi:FUN14 domain-containing protein 1
VLPDTSEILANAGPFGTQVGFGAIAGYAAGVALRVAGTAGLAFAGAGFLALQGLQYKGYVEVDWVRVERELRNTVGDVSKVSSETYNRRLEEVTNVVKFGVPSAGGFSLGLAYGVGGVFGRAAALGGLWTLGPTLGVSHVYQVSEPFREWVTTRWPSLATALNESSRVAGKRLGDVVDGATGSLHGSAWGGSAGESAWRASLREADSLPKLRELERQTRKASGSGFFARRKPTDETLAKKLESLLVKKRALTRKDE